MPNIITELARVASETKAASTKGDRALIEITVREALEIVELWRAMQDDGK